MIPLKRCGANLHPKPRLRWCRYQHYRDVPAWPGEVIRVDILGQERYSRSNITIPPDGRLIPPRGQIQLRRADRTD